MEKAGERLVLREGRDWMEVRKVDSRGRLWAVVDGTVGMKGDIVWLPRLQWSRHAPDDVDPDDAISPFEAEIVVDIVTKAVFLWKNFSPTGLIQSLKAAGLTEQMWIVRRWSARMLDDDEATRKAA